MIQNLTIDCICGRMVPVKELDDELHDEDTRYTDTITCVCGERYQVHIGMSCLGKEKKNE